MTGLDGTKGTLGREPAFGTEQTFGPGSTVAGRYVVEAVLGEGGMGRVLRATETRLGRTVALKVLHGRLARDGDERERFLREARLTASLSHPNILAVYEADVWEDHLYIAMEYVDGGNLADLLEGKLPLPTGLDVLAKVAQALAAAHGAGLIHRDLKPENVLVSALVSSAEGMTVKVADWGLARAIEAPQRLTATGVVLGTPSYMPPEQIRGERLGPAVDCYALGVILYRLVAGRLPFPGPSLGEILAGHLRHEPPALTSLRPGCPPALADLACALLTKDQDHRLGDAGEVARRLDDIGAGLANSPVADLPTRAVSAVRAAPATSAVRPAPAGSSAGKAARAQPRSRAGRGLGTSSAEAPTASLRAAPSRAGARGSAGPAPAPTGRGPGLRGALALMALVIVAGVALRVVATGSSTSFALQGMRLADIDAITVVGAGEPPPDTVLRVIPSDGSAPFQVPLAGEAGGAPGHRTWTVPLGRPLLTKASVEVRGPAFGDQDPPTGSEGPSTAEASVGPADLPPLAALMRLDDDERLLPLIEGLAGPADDHAMALTDAGLTPATVGWLVGRLPRLVPPQGGPTGPVRRLLLPLACLETIRHAEDTSLPDWGPTLRRLGAPDEVLTTDVDENFQRPLPGKILGRAVVHSMKKGPKDSKPRPRMTWVHSPEQYRAALERPEFHIETTDRFGRFANAASASIDDWQPERRLNLPLEADPWPPRHPVMVLDLRYLTHDRALLVSLNGAAPYPVVRPGQVEAGATALIYSSNAIRYLVPLDPADLRQGDNEIVLRSRILRKPLPFAGTRVEGLAVVDDPKTRLRDAQPPSDDRPEQ